MNQVKYYVWTVFAAISMFGGLVCQAADVELLESTIVDNNALNFTATKPPTTFNRNINGRTYQRFPMATFKGYQYATYYDEDRYVCLARRKLPDGAWDALRFTDYTISSSDSHNSTTVGICHKDGTIHLAFDHHADALNYRVSEVGVASSPEEVVWDANLFSAVTDRLGSVGRVTGLTYPSFFNASNGNLMLYYRSGGSGNGDGMIQEYNGTTHDWTTGLGRFISRNGTYSGNISNNSTSRCPYINGISYGGNRLHASWGWRESSAGSSNNHDLNYAYSDDHGRTWYNNAGTKIGTTGTSSVISINSPGLIVADIPQNIGLSNQYTHYAYADGSCHVMVAHSGSYQHYWRNAAGVWNNAALSFGGSRPKMTGDEDGNLFLVYTSGGKPRIAKGVPNAGQTAWSWSLVYTQNVSEGGEGQLDYSRWETERVLSIYGQETPSDSGETPSPLHVFDYKVSTKATQPNPAHGADVYDLDAGLAWSAGLGASTHRVYFGTDRQAVADATTSSPEYQGQQSGTVFMPSLALSEYATYYWRIDEVQANSTVIPGLVWEFTLDIPQPSDIWAAVAHWPLDEASGTAANDISGNGYTGTLLNGAAWAGDGVRDSYVSFDGTDDRISTPFTYALSDANDFTWAWWAKKEPASHSDSIMVGNRYGNTGSENLEFIKLTPSAAQFANTDDANAIEFYEYDDIAASDWHHYAMVKSGTNYQWYVDGAAQGVATNFSYSENSPIPFLIGGDGDNKPNEHFEGGIDDVVLYHRALTAAEIINLQNGIYQPIITMVALDNPENWTDGATWSDGLPAHISSHYIIPDTGNLRSENGTSTFPGSSLSVEAGGKFQFRGKQELGDATTVNFLFAVGGTSGNPVNLAAGTGNNTANVLQGTFQNSGFTDLTGYGSADGPRNIRIESVISGSGTLHSTGTSAYPHTCTIAHADNTFVGVWESDIGLLLFENSGAVGSADITVLAEGKLAISDDWNSDAVLTVADSATAEVDLGSNDWNVSTLVFGSSSVEAGLYTPATLNALGAHDVFVGTGTLRVGPPPVTELIVGWERWASDISAATIENDGILGIASNGAFSTSKWGASTDGTFGSLSSPAASSDNSVSEEGLRKTGASDISIDFAIENTSGVDVELGAFLFDAMLKRNNGGPQQWSLQVLSGSLSIGEVTGGALAYQATGSDLADHDIDLTALVDHTLDAGSNVVFRLSFTGGDGIDSYMDVDNVALLQVVHTEAPELDVSFGGGELTFDWSPTGTHKLQSRTNLVEGIWMDVPGGDIPPVHVIPTNTADFFRLAE